MKILFIMPAIGKPKSGKYLKTWEMEPLSIAVLKSLTPDDIEVEFFDDRIEKIDYSIDVDLVAMTVETYTAKRAYEISKRFRERGIKVVMGGFHPTLMPKEVIKHSDSIVLGEVEAIWSKLLDDFKSNKLKHKYQGISSSRLLKVNPDRTIYGRKKYLKIGLLETGRGCKFNCDFCSITKFYNQGHRRRPIKDVISEIKSLNYKMYFIVDDNVCADREYAKKLFKALIPLKIRWVGQTSITVAQDKELLTLMKKSGCWGVLIGLESMNRLAIRQMKKEVNLSISYSKAVKNIHRMGIRIYTTFIFGYDEDDKESFRRTFDFAMKNKILLVAFNHLIPFPGTPLYTRLGREKRLLYDKWWLDPNYRFGDLAFKPKKLSPKEVSMLCYKYRKKFFSLHSICYRLFNWDTNFESFGSIFNYVYLNYLMHTDVSKRQGLLIGEK